MEGKKIVIALGGNALQSGNEGATADGQLRMAQKTSKKIAEIKELGYKMAVVHGNGPQVGRIVLATEAAKEITPAMPFDVCGAMSQGYIGYHLQQSIREALIEKNLNTPVLSVVTQVVVDKDDQGFKNPTKPIGPFYTEEEAQKLVEETGCVVKEDAGRGYRKVVASPIPKEIVEIDSVKELLENNIVIACGGGGIPVVKKSEQVLEGVAAVIDKDFAAELLAEEIEADEFVILTEVSKVAINFNKENEKFLDKMTVSEAKKYIEEGHFAPGSMLPKVMAALKFVEKYHDKKAYIASLDKAKEALEGKDGTMIIWG